MGHRSRQHRTHRDVGTAWHRSQSILVVSVGDTWEQSSEQVATLPPQLRHTYEARSLPFNRSMSVSVGSSQSTGLLDRRMRRCDSAAASRSRHAFHFVFVLSIRGRSLPRGYPSGLGADQVTRSRRWRSASRARLARSVAMCSSSSDSFMVDRTGKYGSVIKEVQRSFVCVE